MDLDFGKMNGLVPAIIQDNYTQKVLMLGFMNEEAYNKTVETGKVTFFSRTKNRLWTKGEESGNFLHVVSIAADPLEAMQCCVPTIISKQSGCAEILSKCIKTDYWDIHAMADAIHSICTNDSLYEYLRDEGKKEVDGIVWEKVGVKIRALYEQVLKNYGK